MSRVTRAPDYDELTEALSAVKTLKSFCRDFYKMFDTTDLDMLEQSLEDDIEDCGNE